MVVTNKDPRVIQVQEEPGMFDVSTCHIMAHLVAKVMVNIVVQCMTSHPKLTLYFAL